MLRSRLFLMLGVTALLVSAVVVQAWGQDGPPPPPPGGSGGIVITPGGPGGATSGPVVVIPEGPGGEHRQWNPEEMKKRFDEMRKQMSDDMRKQMDATPEEWKVLEPKIQKVTELSMKANFGGGMRFRLRPPGSEEGAAEKPTTVETARAELQKLLKNKDAKPEEVKKALTAYREARDKAKQDSKAEMEKAQKELREVLTQKQEAYLVVRGILD